MYNKKRCCKSAAIAIDIGQAQNIALRRLPEGKRDTEGNLKAFFLPISLMSTLSILA
jgi:hypothetical protein